MKIQRMILTISIFTTFCFITQVFACPTQPPVAFIDTPSLPITVSVGQTVNFTGHGEPASGDFIVGYDWDFPTVAYEIQGESTSASSCKFSQVGTYNVHFDVRGFYGGWSVNGIYDDVTITVIFPLTVENRLPQVNGVDSVILNGEVTSTGGEAPNVKFYYDTTDHGTGSWPSENEIGPDPAGTKIGNFSSVELSDLNEGTTYYFRSYAWNSGGNDWDDNDTHSVSNPFKFVTCPGQASYTYPSQNGASSIPIDVTLTWSAGLSTESVTHHLYLEPQGTSFTTPTEIPSGTTQYAPPSLNYGTTYHWRVDEVVYDAYNDVYRITEGPEWTFTIKQQFTLSLSFDGEGTITVDGEDYSAATNLTRIEGETETLTATAAAGYEFDHWEDGEGNPISTSETINVLMDGSKTRKACFTKVYELNINGINCTVSPVPLKTEYKDGDIVTLTVAADNHFHWNDSNPQTEDGYWLGTGVNESNKYNNPLTITIGGDTTLTALCVIDKYKLTENTAVNGTILKNPDSLDNEYAHGSTVALTAVPNDGYLFDIWIVKWEEGGDPHAVDIEANPLSLYMDSAKTVTAYFIDKCRLTFNSDNVSSSIADGEHLYTPGTKVMVSAVALAEYGDVEWGGTAITVGDAIVNGDTCTVTMDAHYTLTATCSAVSDIIYVSPDGDNSDGQSWQTAFKNLQDALDYARVPNPVDQIWVAAGTYYPDEDDIDSDGAGGIEHTNDVRTETFQLVDGVEIYGGFVGYETSIDQRKPGINETILSGDITGDDVDGMPEGDNSYHVVTAVTGSHLDGFTIQGGLADGTGSDTDGAGILCQGGEITIRNCHITLNKSDLDGAGVYIAGGVASLEMTNCILDGNWASGNGAGIFCASDTGNSNNVTLVNCTIHANKAIGSGGGLYTELETIEDTLTCTNCIFWRNIDGVGNQGESAQIHDAGTAGLTITYSCIDGKTTYNGTGNIDADPAFIQNGEWKWRRANGEDFTPTILLDSGSYLIYDVCKEASDFVDIRTSDVPDVGIIEDYLVNKRPVYDKNGSSTTSNVNSFNLWFNDDNKNNGVPNSNVRLDETSQAGVYSLDQAEFYPADFVMDDPTYDSTYYHVPVDRSLYPHNYHFTFQYHVKTKYYPGQTFDFYSRDDLFVFIDDHLEVAHKGFYEQTTPHTPLNMDTLNDARAPGDKWKEGDEYDFDLFFAQRHIGSSLLQIEIPIPIEPYYIPGDYHIQAYCIDAGNNNAVPSDVNIDFDGAERQMDDPDTIDTGNETAPVVDMGAYEYIAEDYYFDVTAGEDKTATIAGSTVTFSLWDAELISPYADETVYTDTTCTWTVERGPVMGTIEFSDTSTDTSSIQNPHVTLNLQGYESLLFQTVNYVDFILKFTADDQVEIGSDLVKITVYKDGFTQAPPQVTLGGPYVVEMADLPLAITGTISDDGEPVGALTAGWQLTNASSGGGAEFSPLTYMATEEHREASGRISMDVSSQVTFTQPGRYQVKLTAIDGELSGEAFATVEVVRDNNPPTVEAGTYDTIIPSTYPYVLDLQNDPYVTLSPSVVDEGLIDPVKLSWEVITGPINGMPYDRNDPLSKLTFTKTGQYVLQLVANDGQYTVTDQTTITLAKVPQVEAGENKNAVFETGGKSITMSDAWVRDNYPDIPNDDLTIEWSVLQAPGGNTVDFDPSTPGVIDSTSSLEKPVVNFLAVGEYQLQLSATDGILNGNPEYIIKDTAWITITKPVLLAKALFAGGSQSSINNGDGAVVYRKYPGGDWEAISGEMGDAVLSLCVYNGELYAGTMVSTGEAEVRKWDGAAGWSLVSDGWGDDTVTRVYSLAVYNGCLFAGTDAENVLFKYNKTEWAPIEVSGHSNGIRNLYVWNKRLYLDANKKDVIDCYDIDEYYPQVPEP